MGKTVLNRESTRREIGLRWTNQPVVMNGRVKEWEQNEQFKLRDPFSLPLLPILDTPACSERAWFIVHSFNYSLFCAWYCVPWVLKGKKLLTKQFLKVYETMKGNERWVNDAISSLNWCLRLKVTRSDTNPTRIPIQSKFRLGLVLLHFCSTFEPVEMCIVPRH